LDAQSVGLLNRCAIIENRYETAALRVRDHGTFANMLIDSAAKSGLDQHCGQFVVIIEHDRPGPFNR
jgi:hypothetical protein